MRKILTSIVFISAMTLGAHGVEVDTDRPGSDYRNFEIDETNPGPCEQACAAEPQCRAWTYVRPGIQGSRARCWLKSAVPDAYTSKCCISGVSGDDQEAAEAREVQSLLATLGYDPGPIDGKPGRQTRAAIRGFQSRFGLPVNGRISPELIKGLWGVAGDRDLKAQPTVVPSRPPAPPPGRADSPAVPPKPAVPAEDLSDLNSLD